MDEQMKKISLVLSVVLLSLLICPVSAQARASETIVNYTVDAGQGDERGEVSIDFTVRATASFPKLGALKIEIYKANGDYVKTIWGNTSNGLLSPRSGRYYSNTYTSWSIVLCSRYDLRRNRYRLRHKGNYHVNRTCAVLTSRIFFSEESMPRVLFFINNDFQKNFQIWRYHLAL